MTCSAGRLRHGQHRARPDQRRPDRSRPRSPSPRGIWSEVSGTQGTAPVLRHQRVDREPDRQQPDRRRSQPDRPDHDRRVRGPQYCQTFQFPVQIGGSAQTARAQVMPGGIQTPFDFNMTVQLQNMVDDIENCCLLRHRAGASGRRQQQRRRPTAKMNGLRSILQTNNISARRPRPPTNAAAYGSTDLIRDTLQAARTGRRRARPARRVHELHERVRDLGPGHPAQSRPARPSSARRSTCSRPRSCTASRSSRRRSCGPTRRSR